MKYLIKGVLIGAIALGGIVANRVLLDFAATQAAQSVFNKRGYDFSKDVQFSIPELQSYSIEVAEGSVRLTHLYQLGIGGTVLLLSGVVLAVGNANQSGTQRLFKKWLKAARQNDSPAMARIELQVQDGDYGD